MLVSFSILITPLGVNLAMQLFIILLIRTACTAYHVGSWSNLLFILLSRAAIVESQQRNWHYFIKYYLNAMPSSDASPCSMPQTNTRRSLLHCILPSLPIHQYQAAASSIISSPHPPNPPIPDDNLLYRMPPSQSTDANSLLFRMPLLSAWAFMP